MSSEGNHFKRDFGPWKPFPEPLPPPIVDPAESPFLALKFNEAWRPYIVGCLSSLARPETYEDTLDAFIREDIDFGSQLPFLIEPYLPVICPNWWWVEVESTRVGYSTLFKPFAIPDCGERGTGYFAFATQDPILQYCAMEFKGQDLAETLTGGLVHTLWIQNASNNALANIHLYYEECTGNAATIDGFVKIELDEIELRDFYISSSDDFFVWWDNDPQYSCSGA